MYIRALCCLLFAASPGFAATNNAVAAPTTPLAGSATERALAWDALGMSELRAGRYEAGEYLLRKALAIIRDSPDGTGIRIAAHETNLAVALELNGRYEEALNILNHVVGVFETSPRIDAEHFGTALTELSAAEKALGKTGLAEEHGLRAAAILPTAYTQINLAVVYIDEKKTAEAEQILTAVVAEQRKSGPKSLTLGDSLRALARLRAVEHKWTEASSLYREAISVYETALPSGHPELARIRREYAGAKHRAPAGTDA